MSSSYRNNYRSHHTSTIKKRPDKSVMWCPECKNQMVFVSEARTYLCVHCYHSIYLDAPQNKHRTDLQPEPDNGRPVTIQTVDASMGSDGVVLPKPTRKFRSWGRRRGLVNTSNEIKADPELQAMIDSNPSYRLISYRETILQSDGTVETRNSYQG